MLERIIIIKKEVTIKETQSTTKQKPDKLTDQLLMVQCQVRNKYQVWPTEVCSGS